MQKDKKLAIFLDDERIPQFVTNLVPNFDGYDWVVIRNYFDFTKYVDQNIQNIDLVSFDHDIDSFDGSGREWNGKDAADYLLDICIDGEMELPDFIVHSMNPIGKGNIIGLYKNYLDKVEGKIDRDSWTDCHIGMVDGRLILPNIK
jgi:hypothetical protein